MPIKNSLRSPVKTDIAHTIKFVERELKQVRGLIERQLKVIRLGEGVKRLVSSLDVCSGKMIRPALVLMSGAACGPITDRHIRIAAIIEMLHNATLLHDDVIDEGRVRRGKPTVNSLFGNEPAVLLGDFLLSRLFKLCAQLEPDILTFIASTTARICEGELSQMIHRNDFSLNEKEYLKIITEKSAALFSDCCFLGALLAGACEKEKKALSDFGLNFGIAFQLADDLIDIVGDENKSRKTLGSDVNKNKPTLVLIDLLRRLTPAERKKLIRQLSAVRHGQVHNNDISTKTLAKMVESKGSARYVRCQIGRFIERALFTLKALKDSAAKKALIDTAKCISKLTA